MIVHNKQLLTDFMLKHADSSTSLKALLCELEKATWLSPIELKRRYPSASILGGQNVIFNVRGNKYRLWVMIYYPTQIAVAKKIGTHREYDTWEITK